MGKKAIWRDASKTTATGLFIPEHRLKLPFGEAVLKLPLGFVSNADDQTQSIFTIKCSAIGINMAYTTKETDVEKAKSAAVLIIKKHLQNMVESYQEDLMALDEVETRVKKQAASPQEATGAIPDEQASKDTPSAEKPPRARKAAAKASPEMPEQIPQAKRATRKRAPKQSKEPESVPAKKGRKKRKEPGEQ